MLRQCLHKHIIDEILKPSMMFLSMHLVLYDHTIIHVYITILLFRIYGDLDMGVNNINPKKIPSA